MAMMTIVSGKCLEYFMLFQIKRGKETKQRVGMWPEVYLKEVTFELHPEWWPSYEDVSKENPSRSTVSARALGWKFTWTFQQRGSSHYFLPGKLLGGEAEWVDSHRL